MLSLSVIASSFQLLTQEKHTDIQSFSDICRFCGVSIKQFLLTRRSALKAVEGPLSFCVYAIITVHLCFFFLLSIPYYVFFHNRISDRFCAQIAIGMWYLYEQGYLLIVGLYLFLLLYFFVVWLICQRYPSYAQFLYTSFTHTYVAHYVGNSPGKKSSDRIALLAGLGILASLTTLGAFNLNDWSRMKYAEDIVYRALEESKKPGNPSAEVIIAMQISVRRYGPFDAVINRALDSFRIYTNTVVDIAKQQSEIRQNTTELELFRQSKPSLDLALLELEKLKIKQNQLQDANQLTGQSSSTKEAVEELQPIEIPSSLRDFPFTKSDFIPAVWDVLNKVYGDSGVETIESFLDELSKRDNEDLVEKNLITKDDDK
jgi:hypothetical protein